MEEHRKLTDLLGGPIGAELRVARTFLEGWFAIWDDDLGNRHTAQEAERRYQIWRANAEAAKLAPLRRQQQHLDLDHFRRLSAFLKDPKWECTNNAAERGGRAFRHGQHRTFAFGWSAQSRLISRCVLISRRSTSAHLRQ